MTLISEESVDTGLAWLGRRPASWAIEPFFASAVECDRPNVGMKESNLLSLSYGEIVSKDIGSSDGLLPESFETYQIVEPGDVVFRFTDLQNDQRSLRSALVKERGIVTSAYLAVTPRHHLPSYFAYLMRAYDVRKIFYSMGGGLRQSMKYSDVKRLPILVPSLDEQRAVVEYLDQETARIDELIEKQERLIEIFEERARAVRFVAVSGAPTVSLGLYAEVQSGFAFPSSEFSSEPDAQRLLRGINVNPGRVNWAEEVRWRRVASDGLIDFELHDGDVVLGMDRPIVGGGVRVARMGPADLPALLLQRVARIRPRQGLSSDYLYLLLGSQQFADHLIPSFTGVSVPHISADQISGFRAVIPPLAEQARRVEWAGNALDSVDRVKTRSSKSIALLRERRQALISAAVLGQIDVRAR